MSDRATTLKERLKARRSRLQETAGGISEDEPSPRKPDKTWDAAMEEEDEPKSGYASLEMEEEVKESEQLVKNLKKKRKKVKQELDETVRTQEKREDPAAELRRAKQRTKKKVKDAEERSATEAEETAASSEELLDSDRREKPPSRDRTPRGKPKSREPTPRVEEEETSEEAVVRATTSEELMRESTDTQPLISEDTAVKKKAADEGKKTKLSRSMGQSYRDKLAQKMKAAKDKGKDDAYHTGARLLKDKRGPGVTRFDTPDMRKEDIELEETLQKSLTAKAKLRDAAAKARGIDIDTSRSIMSAFGLDDRDVLPTPEESYDFFTRQWEADPEQERLDKERVEREKREKQQEKDKAKEKDKDKEDDKEGDKEGEEEKDEDTAQTPKTPKEGDEVDVEAGKAEDEQPLLDLEDKLEDAWRFYAVAAAEYRAFREVMEEEQQCYYFPSIRPTPLSKKVFDEEAAPRFLEEEGLYVGERPYVLDKSLYKMENRLINEGDQSKDWFGEDGMLLALPDPLKMNPSRPFLPETITEPALQTEFKQAYLNEFDSRLIDGSVEAKGQYMV